MTSPPEDVYQSAARRITHDRMEFYGYTAEHIAAAEAEDHSRCEHQGELGWHCRDEDERSNHPAHDDLCDAAELVMWVLEHPAVAELLAAGVAAGRAQAAADIRAATGINVIAAPDPRGALLRIADVREWAARIAEGGETRG